MFPIRMRYLCEMHVRHNVPRVAKVGTRVPRQEQPQRPPTSASPQIPMDFLLVTNRNLSIIF